MELNSNANGHRLQDDEDLQFLLKGSKLHKVKSKSWKKLRFYKLQDDCKTIWHDSKKLLSSPDKHTFSIQDIEEVRPGRQSEGLQKNAGDVPDSCCFSIFFKDQRKNLDLVASSEEEAGQWVTGLKKVIRLSDNLNSKQKQEHWIYSCLRKADTNSDNKMTFKELKHFLGEINVKVDDLYAEKLFNECDTSHSKTLEGSEIEEFYKRLTYRNEIEVIYSKYASSKGKMSVEDLGNFLRMEQREDVGLNEAVALIQKYELDEAAKEKKLMSRDGFLMYLQSSDGLVLNPRHTLVYQDMSQPLNHYFISSSHNTYLMEDQLKGPSSTEAYVRALTKGCRCVELDCWDGPNGDPVIYHGYTLTSKILFKDVIRTVKEYAFKNSEYPVVLSLETHCSMDQQKVMAHHMKTILGSMLLTAPLGGKMPTHFPSPEQLKGKILVKGKKLQSREHSMTSPESLQGEEEESVSEEDEAADLPEEKGMPKVQCAPAPREGTLHRDLLLTLSVLSMQKSKLKLARELSDLVVFCKSVHFPGFETARETQAFYEMSSFGESKAFKLAQESANRFVIHNTRQLSRTYPRGTRTDSSNYNPVDLWNAGCQIVALNFQTSDKSMDLNQGKFQQNGFSGYILKPRFMRDGQTQFNPTSIMQGEWLTPKKLHVMIISGQQLPKVNKNKNNSIVDPLVRIEISGVPRDVCSAETEHIEDNGFNPSWNKNFQFDICVPELALVRFVVEDHDTASRNDFVAQYTLPFMSLQNGYRHVPLLTKEGNPIASSSIFVHIMVVDQ
ncbi:1-phosphatidylinositol 4,5-bisphosphate phosphodiesterase delta-1-like isoform X2 [Acipenser ruthenus]|uniref:1-phosphatidylinositol 4,5-bisphosphate phosphodiesterase delta-1-like isoform X2 n=1 Tax=Acipenser ruthenus TaxID=7906 RepID=UPI0027427262|nr:1-phosphatidylinositol 4,5-bisphosphate phosphodiesterase delta-1-like isoform X2 [Acipenser ruthenus]